MSLLDKINIHRLFKKNALHFLNFFGTYLQGTICSRVTLAGYFRRKFTIKYNFVQTCMINIF